MATQTSGVYELLEGIFGVHTGRGRRCGDGCLFVSVCRHGGIIKHIIVTFILLEKRWLPAWLVPSFPVSRRISIEEAGLGFCTENRHGNDGLDWSFGVIM
jgi:hypothetical protein